MSKKSLLMFIKEAVTKPNSMGAIIPSTHWLANDLVSFSNIKKANTIIELGCGTGVVTRAILNQKRDDANFFAIELNPKLAQNLQHQFSDLQIYNQCASNLKNILLSEQKEFADTIISSLPWVSFSNDLQNSIIDSIVESMDTGSQFLTFTYAGAHKMPKGRRFSDILNEKFNNVEKSKVTWKNFPPAFVYKCSL